MNGADIIVCGDKFSFFIAKLFQDASVPFSGLSNQKKQAEQEIEILRAVKNELFSIFSKKEEETDPAHLFSASIILFRMIHPFLLQYEQERLDKLKIPAVDEKAEYLIAEIKNEMPSDKKSILEVAEKLDSYSRNFYYLQISKRFMGKKNNFAAFFYKNFLEDNIEINVFKFSSIIDFSNFLEMYFSFLCFQGNAVSFIVESKNALSKYYIPEGTEFVEPSPFVYAVRGLREDLNSFCLLGWCFSKLLHAFLRNNLESNKEIFLYEKKYFSDFFFYKKIFSEGLDEQFSEKDFYAEVGVFDRRLKNLRLLIDPQNATIGIEDILLLTFQSFVSYVGAIKTGDFTLEDSHHVFNFKALLDHANVLYSSLEKEKNRDLFLSFEINLYLLLVVDAVDFFCKTPLKRKFNEAIISPFYTSEKSDVLIKKLDFFYPEILAYLLDNQIAFETMDENARRQYKLLLDMCWQYMVVKGIRLIKQSTNDARLAIWSTQHVMLRDLFEQLTLKPSLIYKVDFWLPKKVFSEAEKRVIQEMNFFSGLSINKNLVTTREEEAMRWISEKIYTTMEITDLKKEEKNKKDKKVRFTEVNQEISVKKILSNDCQDMLLKLFPKFVDFIAGAPNEKFVFFDFKKFLDEANRLCESFYQKVEKEKGAFLTVTLFELNLYLLVVLDTVTQYCKKPLYACIDHDWIDYFYGYTSQDVNSLLEILDSFFQNAMGYLLEDKAILATIQKEKRTKYGLLLDFCWQYMIAQGLRFLNQSTSVTIMPSWLEKLLSLQGIFVQNKMEPSRIYDFFSWLPEEKEFSNIQRRVIQEMIFFSGKIPLSIRVALTEEEVKLQYAEKTIEMAKKYIAKKQADYSIALSFVVCTRFFEKIKNDFTRKEIPLTLLLDLFKTFFSDALAGLAHVTKSVPDALLFHHLNGAERILRHLHESKKNRLPLLETLSQLREQLKKTVTASRRAAKKDALLARWAEGRLYKKQLCQQQMRLFAEEPPMSQTPENTPLCDAEAASPDVFSSTHELEKIPGVFVYSTARVYSSAAVSLPPVPFGMPYLFFQPRVIALLPTYFPPVLSYAEGLYAEIDGELVPASSYAKGMYTEIDGELFPVVPGY